MTRTKALGNAILRRKLKREYKRYVWLRRKVPVMGPPYDFDNYYKAKRYLDYYVMQTKTLQRP